MPYDRNNPHPHLSDYGGNYGYSVGDKYDSALGIVEIAKRVRAEIKDAIKAGRLPQLKASVRIDRYSGGQSLDVAVSDVGEPILNEERLREQQRVGEDTYVNVYHFPVYNDRGRQILETLKGLVGAYNYDRSDSQSDFFSVNFYGGVKYDWEWERGEKARAHAALQTGLAPVLPTADDEVHPAGDAPTIAGPARPVANEEASRWAFLLDLDDTV